tara:strand:- start:87 stop:248 length:162 start_codon:yes stop_codon:yes gene_type:complete
VKLKKHADGEVFVEENAQTWETTAKKQTSVRTELDVSCRKIVLCHLYIRLGAG